MIEAVADTHALLFYLTDDPKLSAAASAALDHAIQSSALGVSTISLAEIVYLEEKGRVPTGIGEAIEGFFGSSFQLLDVQFDTIRAMKSIPRDEVPDFPDRLIAATAVVCGVPLITADSRIRASRVQTIW